MRLGIAKLSCINAICYSFPLRELIFGLSNIDIHSRTAKVDLTKKEPALGTALLFYPPTLKVTKNHSATYKFEKSDQVVIRCVGAKRHRWAVTCTSDGMEDSESRRVPTYYLRTRSTRVYYLPRYIKAT